MAEAAKEVPVDQAPKEDPIKNLKAEFDRKLDSKIGNLEKSNQALMAQLQAISSVNQTPKEPAAPKKQIKDIWYDNPEEAAQVVVNEATSRMRHDLQVERQAEQKKQTVIQSLYREYPELQDFDHPMTLKAVELFDKLPDEEKSHPMAYRLAVKEAAEELDIKPKAKRKKDDNEDFSLSTSGTDREGRKGSRRSDRLDEKTIDFARLVGLDVDDDKVMESLKGRAKRTNWNRWE